MALPILWWASVRWETLHSASVGSWIIERSLHGPCWCHLLESSYRFCALSVHETRVVVVLDSASLVRASYDIDVSKVRTLPYVLHLGLTEGGISLTNGANLPPNISSTKFLNVSDSKTTYFHVSIVSVNCRQKHRSLGDCVYWRGRMSLPCFVDRGVWLSPIVIRIDLYHHV